MATGTIKKGNLKDIDFDDTFLLVSYSASTAATSPYGWSINITQTGYTPVSYSINHGNSGSTYFGAETFNATTLSGFCSRGSMALVAKVFYVKTNKLKSISG